ncbi:MAG TPA: discoidin domain-containing protein [Acidobacteriaceae bacterium]|nr:discoidin domain-containing protein [Acidobacteriaceae bacterium]
MKRLLAAVFCIALAAHAQQYTRGLGVYPGDPAEYTGPKLVIDATNYRNLALHRAAYQSSAYDYNLTAQLVTDGIRERTLPQWIVASTSSSGILPKQQQNVFLDGNIVSSIDVTGDQPWVEFDIEGGGHPPELDRLDLWLRRLSIFPLPASGWTYIVLGSDDRTTWHEVGRSAGTNWPSMRFSGPSFVQPIPFTAPAHYRSYRVQLSAGAIRKWGVAELVPYDKQQEVHIGGPYTFSSAWMSAGTAEEWVYVDLGAPCTFDRVALFWLQRPAAGSIQASDDAVHWSTLQPLLANSALNDDLHLAQPAHGRYVRMLMTEPQTPGQRYILSEMEVYGRGGPVPQAQPAQPPQTDGTLNLARGAWRLERASLVSASGEQLSEPGFADADWMPATVPGTVLTSYLNDGAVPDPDFGDYQYAISDSYFCSDFWYRDEFIAPALPQPDGHYWLNFDGVNWKAEVYLNGKSVGRIEGAFMRARADVTKLIHPGAPNALAVRIIANANPGGTKDKAGRTVNGGALGRDNPTYHASIGWDWMDTIRGRDDGIWDNVTLTTSGPVTIESPLVTTTLPLPDISQADVAIEATLHNLEPQPVSGRLHVKFGNISVEQNIELAPQQIRLVKFNPSTNPALHLRNPKLWWPVGYGDPNLYPVTIDFTVANQVSAKTSFEAGIRQFTYSEDGDALKMWINGRRFIARGGNWGFSENLLRYRRREYDVAMRYHRDLHFNMIRNWVGQTGDDALYDAADRYGIVIWQDFWLANPWDGPDPDNNSLFLANAWDYLLRIRNHASLGLFCGRNEGFPPDQLDAGLRSLVATLRPGSHYISSSADGPVSGHGPYQVEPLRWYFEHPPAKFHSEMGSPNVPELSTLLRTMPQSALWPQGYEWPLHDYFIRSMYPELHLPPSEIDSQFGGATNIDDWVQLAQFVDYNAYRGMYEGQSKNRMGLLIWMSHPAWPSILWQTYDYFFDTDAGYFGSKKGAEPLHIQWNAANDAVEVVNDSAGNQSGLTARAQVINLDGSVKWTRSANLDSNEDSTVSPFSMQYPAGLSKTHFIRLTLLKGGKVLSSNFYLRGVTENDYSGIRQLSPATVDLKPHIKRHGSQWDLTADLRNTSKVPALMVRIKVVREKTGDLIAPALFDDNYIALMPGERRTLHVQLDDGDTRGEQPRLIVEGYNLANPGKIFTPTVP